MLEPILMSKGQADAVTLLFQGKSQKEIAADLGIPVSAVKARLKTVYEKAGASGALDLLSMAYRNGGFLY
jgi:DNA-binding NarL/FixJ family response regulator